MRMARTIFVWTLAAAAAGGWWALRERGAVATRAEERERVFDGAGAVDVDRVATIRLERGGTRYVFTKDGSRWRQTEPFAADLDEFSARQLIAQAADLRAFRRVEAMDAPANGPAATLTLEAGDRRWEIAFDRRGVAGRAWIRTGNSSFVTDAALYERAVEMDPKEWRSRMLFPDALGRPTAIRRVVPNATIELTRTGERWAITEPLRTRADAGRVDELLGAIVRARSEGFLYDQPKDLVPFGLATPDARLEIEFAGDGGAAKRTLLVGAPLGVGSADRYAMIEGIPSVVRLSTGTQAMLFPAFESLIDPVATAVRAADVKRIEIRGASETVELTRSLDHWTVAASKGGTDSAAIPANVAAVDALLTALCTTRAPEMGLGAFPKEMEVATVLLFGFDGKPLDVIRVARDSKSSRWGFENGDNALRVHAATLVLPLGFDDFARTN